MPVNGSELRRSALAATMILSLVAAAGCGGSEPAALPPPAQTAAETMSLRIPSKTNAVADVTRIACNAEETTILASRVRPQRDGIHLSLENEAGRPLSYLVESSRGGGRGADLPVAGIETVVSMPPGRLAAVCFDPYSKEDPSEKERAEIEVVDALGLWTPSILSSSCKTGVSTTADYAAGTEGEGGAPVEIARLFLEQRGVLKPRDVIEKAGYPEQSQAVVRLAREGETLAIIEFMSDGKGGWLQSTVTACTGIGLA